MNEIEQATELRRLIDEAIYTFRPKQFDEGEVQFRHDAIRGMLIMAQHDVKGMIEEWSKGSGNDRGQDERRLYRY